MNRLIVALLLVVAFFAGLSVSHFMPGQESGTAAKPNGQEVQKKPLYWVAPMDANYRRDKPGKSPMGMDLVPVFADETGTDNDAGVVRISSTVENNLGVRIAPVRTQILNRQIETVGYIQFDENKLSHLHSRVDGWIKTLNVTTTGDRVSKGQQLFELYAPELVNAQEEYLAALASNNRRLLKASAEKLQSFGINEQQIVSLKKTKTVQQNMPFYSDHKGYVAKLTVRKGAYIRPATELITIGDLSTVWVIAEIFERQANWVKPGQAVLMRSESYPNRAWEGIVNYIYPVLEAQTRTVRVRIVFNNVDETLKPNMFAMLTINTGDNSSVLSVPREAIIHSDGMTRVVKALGEGRFKSVRIETGIESGQQVQVLGGLREGDSIVVSAQFLIDSESSTNADLSRIEGQDRPAKAKDSQSDVAGVWATGIIVDFMPGHRMATIRHEPVPEWNWPEMVMDFLFAKNIDLSTLSHKQTIDFFFEKQKDGQMIITEIKIKAQGQENIKDQETNQTMATKRHHESSAVDGDMK